MNDYEEKMQKLLKRQKKANRYFLNALISAVILILVNILYVIIPIFFASSIIEMILLAGAGACIAAAAVFLLLGVTYKSDKKIKTLSAEPVRQILEERFDHPEYKPLGYLSVPDLNALYPGGVKSGVVSSGTDLIKAGYKERKFSYSSLQLTQIDDDGVPTVLFRGHVIKTCPDHSFPVKVIIQTSDAQKQWNGNRQGSWDRSPGCAFNVYTEPEYCEKVQSDEGLMEKIKKIRDYIKCPFTLIIQAGSQECALILETGSYWFGGHGEVTIDATMEKAKRCAGYITNLLDILLQ